MGNVKQMVTLHMQSRSIERKGNAGGQSDFSFLNPAFIQSRTLGPRMVLGHSECAFPP